MDSFQTLLLDVANELGQDDVRALTFLCHDLLNRNPSAVTSATDLFSQLRAPDHLSSERPELLTDLLLTLGRLKLVKKFSLATPGPAYLSPITPYRKMLYSLYKDILHEEFIDMKFLLAETLSKRKLEESHSVLDIFLEMEHQDLLSDTKLDKLEWLIENVHPSLRSKIDQYKDQHEASLMSVPPPLPHHSILSGDAVGFSGTEENGSLPEAEETSATSEHLGEYSMTAGKRGTCLIINNLNFTPQSKLLNRRGSNCDAESLSAVFSWLGFDVDVRLDCSAAQVLSVLQKLGEADHSEADCVACCFLSHGLEGGVHGVDGGTVELRRLTEPLNGSSCASLAGKPKLFFIQACQGNMAQSAVLLEADGPEGSHICSDGGKDSVPSDADFLLAMATVPSYVSFRDSKKGSWFIQSLCQNLVRMVPSGVDLVSILTKVNADVSLQTNPSKTKQMPQPSFSLRKKVVFPVPEAAAPHLTSH